NNSDDAGGDGDDDEEDDDALDDLTEEEHEVLMENTASVRATLDKICKLSFAIIHLTTIALPAWHKACTANSHPIHLIPCDVKTCWNSMYDMLTAAFDY
ncbi:hypothetical protein L208DRAFT_1161611, partial [Tricholoma matsutake]